jgi:hypothetical protein
MNFWIILVELFTSFTTELTFEIFLFCLLTLARNWLLPNKTTFLSLSKVVYWGRNYLYPDFYKSKCIIHGERCVLLSSTDFRNFKTTCNSIFITLELILVELFAFFVASLIFKIFFLSILILKLKMNNKIVSFNPNKKCFIQLYLFFKSYNLQKN